MPTDPRVHIEIKADTAAMTLAALRLWLLAQEVHLTATATGQDGLNDWGAEQEARAQLDIIHRVFDQIGR